MKAVLLLVVLACTVLLGESAVAEDQSCRGRTTTETAVRESKKNQKKS
jgi:hypothetical protein